MVQLTPNRPHVNLRVKFIKKGSLQYISHLDLVRTMHKIIVRAGLPLWYTEGFNPKPKMVFAAPLSIGVESVCEFMDIKLIDDMPVDEVIKRLNANMTDEMQVIDAYYTEEKLTALKWLSYNIVIKTCGASEELAERCQAYLTSGEVLVVKKKKNGELGAESNISSEIREARCAFKDGNLVIDCVLSADASSFLNPEYIVKALRGAGLALMSPDLLLEYYSIMRLEAFCEDMSEFK